METFFENIPLGLNHVQVIVRGLYAVATCDEVHHTEQVLIHSFYDACRNDVAGLADFHDIVGQEFNPEQAAEILNTLPLRRTFLKSCLLLAFADGKYSATEQAKIGELARALGTDEAMLEELREEVSDYLFKQIAGIQNLDALRAVARELSGQAGD